MGVNSERRMERRQTQAGLFDAWILKIKRWLDLIFGSQSSRVTITVRRVFESDFVYLKLLETEYSDELTERIRHWQAISKSTEIPYDLVITCDRLKRTLKSNLEGDITIFVNSHRFAVFRISKYLIGNRRRKDQVLVVDLDCVNTQVFRGLDGFAPQIADSLAIQLSKRSLADLKLLILFENQYGIESAKTRLEMGNRWLTVLMAYHESYFPKK